MRRLYQNRHVAGLVFVSHHLHVRRRDLVPREHFRPALARGFHDADLDISDDAVESILDLAEDVPYNVQRLAHEVWAVTLAASAGFGIGLPATGEALRLFAVFAGINLIVCLFWTTIGHVLSGVLQSDRVWRVFMTGMALVMASTVVLIFI